MSKFIVYILDKTVWLLLATVITGQALQLAGIMQTPKSAGAIEFQQNSLDNSQIYPENSLRWKRDTSTEYTTERSQFIDMLFNRKKSKEPTGWVKRIQTTMSYFKAMNKVCLRKLFFG
ncbi:hypothetical protein ABEB36_013703 [Hypothenemus hampei]|uniref:Uncharacterized protein n=1 Tax=Hypothenemus hampei TaxID=57062 RepID=A0ABD1E7T2_HYPHA